MRVVLGMILLGLAMAPLDAFGQTDEVTVASDGQPAASPAAASDYRIYPGPRVGFDISADVSSGPLGLPLDRLQARAETAMLDFYPGEATGLHFSAGLRLFRRYNFWRDAQNLTNGMLTVTRSLANAGNHVGVKRYTPAATLGYSLKIDRSLSFDFEAGTSLGASVAGSPIRFGPADFGRSGGEATRINPVAHLSLGYAF